MAYGKPTDGVISRYLNRRISGAITNFILRYDIRITPTQVSIISFLIGVSASPLYLSGLYWLAGVLVQISSILDGVDGELARARNMVSVLGGFIDTLMDRVVNILVISSIGFLVVSDPYSLAIVLAALSGDMFVTYLHAVVKKDFGIHPALIGHVPPLASRDVRLFIVFVSSLAAEVSIDYLLYGLAVVAFISYLYLLFKAIEVYRYAKSKAD